MAERRATKGAPRFVHMDGFEVLCRNEDELRIIGAEVFDEEEYALPVASDRPRILDCGSHVGLSVLFFKRRYPGCRLVAFEPEPGNLRLLETNLARNGFRDVTVVPAAVYDHDGEVRLHGEFEGDAPWTWDASVLPDLWAKGPQQSLLAPCVRLSRWLDEPADIVKLDVEGAEERVLEEIAPRLDRVGALVVEVHPGARGRPAAVDGRRVARILRGAGFRLQVVRSATKRPYLVRALRPHSSKKAANRVRAKRAASAS